MREIHSYCSMCRDNTVWKQFSQGMTMENPTNPDRKMMMASFRCNQCGHMEFYTYFPDDE